jgi:hypothetical protein
MSHKHHWIGPGEMSLCGLPAALQALLNMTSIQRTRQVCSIFPELWYQFIFYLRNKVQGNGLVHDVRLSFYS